MTKKNSTKVKWRSTKKLVEASKTSGFSVYGTVSNVAMTSQNGQLPARSFSGRYFPDYKKIGPEQFVENLNSHGGRNHVPCQPGCVIQCSNHYHDVDGKYVTGGFEYETIALCGSNLEISDLDVIARIDRICDDFCVDSMEIGTALGICMDMGIIPWGDADGVFGLLQQMVDGTELGRVLGNGAYECGLHLGCQRVATVKKQAMAGYDPRNAKGTGVTYAVCPQGADHTAGAVGMGDGTKKMMLPISKKMQQMLGSCDNFMCLFCWALGTLSNPQLLGDMLYGLYGVEEGMAFALDLTSTMIATEKEFNRRAGFTSKDDDLPAFFKTEKSACTGEVFDFESEEFEGMFDLK